MPKLRIRWVFQPIFKALDEVKATLPVNIGLLFCQHVKTHADRIQMNTLPRDCANKRGISDDADCVGCTFFPVQDQIGGISAGSAACRWPAAWA
jgi:hypothetical protein